MYFRCKFGSPSSINRFNAPETQACRFPPKRSRFRLNPLFQDIYVYRFEITLSSQVWIGSIYQTEFWLLHLIARQTQTRFLSKIFMSKHKFDLVWSTVVTSGRFCSLSVGCSVSQKIRSSQATNPSNLNTVGEQPVFIIYRRHIEECAR